MKKSYFLTLSLLILAMMSSLAQAQDETRWYFGGGGNANSTWIIYQNIYGEPLLNYKFTPSFAVNANIGFDFATNWGIKMELGYALLGQKYEGHQYDQSASRNIKITYFLFPVMVKYRAGGEKIKFYAMAGPQLGALLSASQEYKRNGTDAPVFITQTGSIIDVSKKEISDRYTGFAGFVRIDLGIELTPSDHLMIDIGLSTGYSITDLNAHSWRLDNIHGTYHNSHNFYGGLNVGINYRL